MKINPNLIESQNMFNFHNVVNGHYNLRSNMVDSYSVSNGTINIINKGSISYAGVSCKFNTIANHSYTFKANVNNTTRIVISDLKGGKETVLVNDENYTNGKSITFTALSSDTWIIFYSFTTTSCNWTNIMFNEGSTILPYADYTGKLIYKVDVEDIPLWSGTWFHSFDRQTITLNQSMANFKYIVIEYHNYANGYIGVNSNQYPREPVTQKFIYREGYGAFIHTEGGYLRTFAFVDDTHIAFDRPEENGVYTDDLKVCVPVNIYGTNTL